MTSSNRHLTFGHPKWDYSIQRYKNTNDPFLEKGLFSIIFLACGRHELTKRCLLASIDCIKKYTGEIEWIFLENGGSQENYHLFKDQNLERKVIIQQENFGINEALNQGWAISRGEWVFILENDWEPHILVDFLTIVKDIFTEKNDIGIVQLRSIIDNNEQWGRGKPKYWPWDLSQEQNSLEHISVWNEVTKSGHKYMISNFPNGFNNNPSCIAKKLYRELGVYPECEIGTDPRHGETLYQTRFAQSGAMTAHICLDLYHHIGKVQTNANVSKL